MEHPPLVAGQTVRFAVHLTRLARLQRAERRAAVDRDDTRSRGRGRDAARIRAAAPGRVPRRRDAARGGPLSLGADRRRSRALRIATTSARSTVFADEPRRSRTPRSSQTNDAGRDRLSQGTAVDEPVRDGAGAAKATCGRRSASRRRSNRSPAERRSCPRRPTAATVPARCRRSAIASRLARCSVDLEPRLARRRRRPRDARGGRRRSAGVARGRATPIWRAPSGCSTSARCPADASKTRSARTASPRPRLHGGAGAARAARSSAAAAAAAPRQATPSCCARRLPAASPRSSRRLGASYDEGAPLFRIVRTDRVELQAQVPAGRRAAVARDHRARARNSRAGRTRSR